MVLRGKDTGVLRGMMAAIEALLFDLKADEKVRMYFQVRLSKIERRGWRTTKISRMRLEKHRVRLYRVPSEQKKRSVRKLLFVS